MNYLDTMGIQCWQSRQPLAGAKLTLPNFQLLALYSTVEENILSGYLILQDDSNTDKTAQNELLAKMLQAVQLRSVVIEQAETPAKILLIMGTQLPDDYQQLPLQLELDDATIIKTLHPADLLHNPALKRQAWQDLKALLPASQ